MELVVGELVSVQPVADAGFDRGTIALRTVFEAGGVDRDLGELGDAPGELDSAIDRIADDLGTGPTVVLREHAVEVDADRPAARRRALAPAPGALLLRRALRFLFHRGTIGHRRRRGPWTGDRVEHRLDGGVAFLPRVVEPDIAAPNAGEMVLRVVQAGEAQPRTELVALDRARALWKSLGHRVEVAPLPVSNDVLPERVHVLGRRGLGEQDEQVQAASAIGVEQQRVVAAQLKRFPPGAGGDQVAARVVLGIDRVDLVQVDVDGEPLASVLGAGGVQADEVVAAQAAEVARQLLQRHHVAAALGFLWQC